MRYVAAKAQGVPCIEEGRIFLIDPRSWSEGDFVPPEYPPGSITLKGGTEPEIRLAGEQMPAVCPECSSLLEHSMLCHTYQWMEMLFACPNHPGVVWIDVFPKADGPDTSWDKTNAWPEFVDRAKRIELDQQRIQLDHIIQNMETPRDRYRKFVKDAPVRFCLTPQGLKATSVERVRTTTRGFFDFITFGTWTRKTR